MFRRYPPFEQRSQMIIDLLTRHPQGLRQVEIARCLNYPAKMVMKDLDRLEKQLNTMLCLDESGRFLLYKIAYR